MQILKTNKSKRLSIFTLSFIRGFILCDILKQSRRRQNLDFGQAGEKVSGHFTSLHVPQALHLSKQLKTQVILQSGIFCVFSFTYIQSEKLLYLFYYIGVVLLKQKDSS